MVSRVLGLIRETMNAHQFGANKEFDAFTVAFMLPNLFRRIFAEGAFSQAFVPLLAEYKNTEGETAARAFVAHVAGLLSVILVAFTALGVIAAPLIVWLAASGFAPGKFALTVTLTRITFPYIMLISLSSLAGGILNTWNRFSVPAFTPTLLNLSMIGCGYLFAPHAAHPIVVLAASVTLGGVLQLAFQLPYLRHIGMLPRPRLDLGDARVWLVLRKMGPAIFGVSIAQISLLMNRNFASHLADGSMSWLYYSDRLMELPTGVLGVALGTILLPSLSTLRSAGDEEGYSATLDWGLRLCWLLALPAAVALAVIAEPIIATVCLSGEIRRARCIDDREIIDRLCGGFDGPDCRKNSGASLLRAKRCQNAGQDRRANVGCHPVVELRIARPSCACRPGTGHQPGRLPERQSVAHRPVVAAHLSATCRLALVFVAAASGGRADGRRLVFRNALAGRLAGARTSPVTRAKDGGVDGRRCRYLLRGAWRNGFSAVRFQPPHAMKCRVSGAW